MIANRREANAIDPFPYDRMPTHWTARIAESWAQQIPIPVSSKAEQLLGFSYRDLDRFDLYLYKFDGVNLGQFSPTETKLAANANQALGDYALDPHHLKLLEGAADA